MNKQSERTDRYKRKAVRIIKVEIPRKDSEMLEHVESQPSKQGYIKALIKKDMEENK